MKEFNVIKSVKNIGTTLKNQTGQITTIMDAHDRADTVNPIEWNNYNYPPIIRLYHYQTNGIK